MKYAIVQYDIPIHFYSGKTKSVIKESANRLELFLR